jgi:hypothetical protein
MQLPIYKELFIKKADKDLIKKIFAASSIGRAPIVIKIEHLKDQHTALSIIEDIFRENLVSTKFPYPIYVLSTVENYIGDLNIIANMDNMPKFFQKRDKMLNVKEQNAINKVKIYQNKLFNTNVPEQMKKVQDYAAKHKELYMLSREGSYLEDLLLKVKD